MRVLHVISDSNIGGAGVLLLNLLRHFDSVRVTSVVALPRDSLLRERVVETGAEVRELENPCDRMNIASVRELTHLIRREEIVLVHANAAVCARAAGRLCGINVIHTRHCCFPPSGIWKLPPVRLIGGIGNRGLSDIIVATADAAAENLCLFGIPKSKIRVIINGSDPVREVGTEELNKTRERFSLKQGDFCVGICARLEPCKGHETFLRAAKLATEKMPEMQMRFLIAGTGTLRRELEETAEKLGIIDVVRFCGFLTDMAPFYRLLRINVNCSNGTETSCLAVSEGLSASVPALVSDYGGNRAMIGDSDAGAVFPVGDADVLADLICMVARSPEREERMRKAAEDRYQNKFTAAQMTEHLTAVYEELCGVRSAGCSKQLQSR